MFQSCRQSQNTHFMFNNFFFSNNCTIYVIWKNTVEPGRPQMTVWRMHIACWIPKATNTHSEYVILIVFPLQHWLHKHASMLCYTYIASLVFPSVWQAHFHLLGLKTVHKDVHITVLCLNCLIFI